MLYSLILFASVLNEAPHRYVVSYLDDGAKVQAQSVARKDALNERILEFKTKEDVSSFLQNNEHRILSFEPDYRITSFGQWPDSRDSEFQPYFEDFEADNRERRGAMSINSALAEAKPKHAVTIAVFDTGHYFNPDIEWYLEGYDFTQMNSDTEDRFQDSFGKTCYDGHGTSVASVAGAIRGNNIGVKGVLSSDSELVNLLPIRVTGRADEAEEFECTDFNVAFGWMSDVALGIHWVIGDKSVPELRSVPPYKGEPVQVINLSLGSYAESCPAYLQQAIDSAIAQGVSVVAAAGNDSDSASNFIPASCDGVITVGSTTLHGERERHTNFGPAVNVSAEGDAVAALIPEAMFGYDYYVGNGTSLAAPFVSASIALAYQYTGLIPPNYIIESAVNPFIQDPLMNCEHGSHDCLGTGILDSKKLLRMTKALTEIPNKTVLNVSSAATLPCPQRVRHEERNRVLGIAGEMTFVELPEALDYYGLKSVTLFDKSSGIKVGELSTGSILMLPDHRKGKQYSLKLCFERGCSDVLEFAEL